MKIVKKILKNPKSKDNNNSADLISPSYIYGCGLGCSKFYCYVSRYNKTTVYVNENIEDIFEADCKWVEDKPWPKIPNQQDDVYYMSDISCNSDIVGYQKHIDLIGILKMYDNHPKLNSTFATKFPTMLQLDVRDFNKKPRVRVSLMPQIHSTVLEPNTNLIIDRIKSINRLRELGWDCQINFSPIVITNNWYNLYKELFELVRDNVDDLNLKCECIFMTTHNNNVGEGRAKQLMSYASEVKNSNGTKRYPIRIKRQVRKQFINLLHEVLPSCEIRYIF